MSAFEQEEAKRGQWVRYSGGVGVYVYTPL